jgi:hypothetical protein
VGLIERFPLPRAVKYFCVCVVLTWAFTKVTDLRFCLGLAMRWVNWAFSFATGF